MSRPSRKQVEITPENYQRLEAVRKNYPMNPSIPKLVNEAIRLALPEMERASK